MNLPKLYVAGPMTGLPELNFPAFHAASEALEKLGFPVINPALNEKPEDPSWANWMRLSIKQVADADGLALLPDWSNSPGARLEHHIAKQLSLTVMSVEAWLKTGRRIQRLSHGQSQWGHAGQHRGSGAPDCPRTMHHHHDDFCALPTWWECEMAGVEYQKSWPSRAGASYRVQFDNVPTGY